MTVFIESLDIDKYKWIDTRFDLGDAEARRKLYEKEHVEGAIYWDLEKNLSDMAAVAGRHPMPSKQQLTELMQASGLKKDDSIILYDQGGSPYAARAWWILKYCGFENAFISKKGFDGLKQQGIALSAELPHITPTNEQLEFNEEIYADQNDVKKIVDGRDLGILLDARSAERYAGLNEPIDKIAGRIPGAHNYGWSQLVKNGEFHDQEDFTEVLQKNEPAIVYCGSGVTAAPLYAMLAEKGFDQLRLYTGSYSDWISNAENVVEFDREEMADISAADSKDVLAKLIEEGYTGEMLMKKFEYEKSLLEEK